MAKEERHINRLNMISKGWNLVFAIILLIIALLVIIPMVLIVIISFSSELSIANKGFSFFPDEWTLNGYKYLFKTGDQLLDSYLITIFYSITGTVMSLSVMTMYAYVISQRNFKHCRFLTWFLFFTMLFSGGLVPGYILNVRYLHINNTVWIFLLPSLVNAYYTIILRTFIRTTIPDTLFDAARIDGAGHFRIFISIVLPLFKTGIATVGLFSLVSRWNDWFIGMLYIENPKLVPLQTLLTKLQDSINYLKQNAAIAGTPDGIALLRTLPQESLRMACTVAVILPILFAYPFFQRYFVQGLTVGSIKG
ncbi:MAG: carbohydrate ABC transporter permease [Caldicoprobacterales bacterium]|jgi:putative aldouronate transport system permease protein|nr:carbohydrate ABC transporter permease [Clostridiales bacterium]